MQLLYGITLKCNIINVFSIKPILNVPKLLHVRIYIQPCMYIYAYNIHTRNHCNSPHTASTERILLFVFIEWLKLNRYCMNLYVRKYIVICDFKVS